jgi:predicted MPP superfamily phosphohydrolase
MAWSLWRLRRGHIAFSVAHLTYLTLVISVPLLGIGCIVAWWWALRPRRGLLVAGTALLLPIPVGLYATHIAPFRLHRDRVAVHVAAARAPTGTLRIGVLADIQLIDVTGYEWRAVRALMAQEPDVIVIAGDLFQGTHAQFRREVAEYRRLLGALHAPGGVYLVPGDVDGGELPELVRGTGVVLLEDEVARFLLKGVAVNLGGLRLDWQTAAARRVYRALERVPDDELAILLSHRPDSVLDLPRTSRVDLTIAGHTHGGQIALPGIGPLVTLTRVPRAVAAGGLHTIDGNPIYVSTGIGVERGHAPQIRLFTRPSYGVIDVTGPAT